MERTSQESDGPDTIVLMEDAFESRGGRFLESVVEAVRGEESEKEETSKSEVVEGIVKWTMGDK